MENQEQNILAAKVSDFKEIVSSFSQLLQAENEALEKFDLAKVSELYEQKSKTVTAYRNMVAYFIKNQESLKALPEADRNNLRDISQQLDELIRKTTFCSRPKCRPIKWSWIQLSTLPRLRITQIRHHTAARGSILRLTTTVTL